MPLNPFDRASLARLVSAQAVILISALCWSGAADAQRRTSLQDLQDQVSALNRTTTCLNLPTVNIDVPVLSVGSYLASGAHLASNSIVGQFLDGATVRGPYRNYFAYDLRRLMPAPVLNEQDLVVAGELITYNKGAARGDAFDGFRSDGTDSLTLVLNRAAWPSNDAVAALMAGTGGAGAYVDLADGPVYAHYVASTANNGTQFDIALSAMAIRDLNMTNGRITDRDGRLLFAIGGAISPQGGLAGNAYFLAGGVPYATLALKVKRYQNTGCPKPTVSQYQ